MAITLPHTFHDGVAEAASGLQLMENLNLLKGLMDPLFGGATGAATYAALSAPLTAGVEYEPSATRPSWVGLQYIVNFGGKVTLKVTAGGVLLPELRRQNRSQGQYGPFPLPPGKKWKYEYAVVEGGELTALRASYLIV